MAELDAVQIQMDIQSAVDETARNIREHAFRQVMVMVNKLQVDVVDINDDQKKWFQKGHEVACMQIYDDIVDMIAKDAATQHEQ